MTNSKRGYGLLLLILLVAGLLGCQQDDGEEAATIISPTQTVVPGNVDSEEAAQSPTGDLNFLTVATDAPSRFQDFEDIDEFGNVVGFDPAVLAELAAEAGFEYEFVVTGFNGLLDSVINNEFDIAMSALIIPEQPLEGLTYTEPYLEVGQVLVVRANETELDSYRDISIGIPIGAQQFSSGEQAARTIVGLSEPDLQLYDSTPEALQALINLEVEGVILDNDDAESFTRTYQQQLKIAGGSGKEAWITQKTYGIALEERDEALLKLLNEAIGNIRENGTLDRLVNDWMVPNEAIDAGESLIGTPDDELVLGIVGQLENLDPAARNPDLVNWEIARNTMSGLLMIDSQNQLVPILAEDFPIISEDKREVTFRLRSGLTFPDGSELTADDVRFSISRAASLGNFQVNRYLKDDNEDNFADADAVQVIDPQTIKFVLKAPTAYFPSVVATPPFYIVSQACYANNPDPVNACGGIGIYNVVEWEPGSQMRLAANPQWPGEAPKFANIQLRFYESSDQMRRSLENDAVDLAWTGLTRGDVQQLSSDPSFTFWEGPSTFKSYLVFEQSETPWSNARLREAIALAIDRQALASEVFGDTRKPLYSPVPGDTPGHLATEPARDLETARSILTALGYSPGSKLEMTIWFVNDGRYTDLEEQYATLLKQQLDETDLIEVTLQGAPWQIFRPESLNCSYPAYLLGWPSITQPASYLDAMSWMEYFITNTDAVCSNFESQAMDDLYAEAMEENDENKRLELYGQIQELWAKEYPTLDLTQEPRKAISLANVEGVTIDAMGLLHYEMLAKSGE